VANNQDTNGEFRPFVCDNFKNGQYIQAGGSSSTPYLRGVQDLVYNHNTLMARARHALVVQDDCLTAVAITATPATPIPFAKYIIYVPAIPGRTTVDVSVLANTTAATTYKVRGSTATGTGAFSALTASGTEVAVTVPVATGSFQVLTLDFDLSGAGDFLPKFVYVSLSPITTTAIGLVSSGEYTPQDVVQGQVDYPLTVVMLQDMVRANQDLYKNNVRCIQNWSHWGNWTSGVLTSNVGLNLGAAGSTGTKPILTQLYYVPRQGVTGLSLFFAGRTIGGSSKDISVSFKEQNWMDYTVSSATTTITEGNWVVWNSNLIVPQGTVGPLYLDLALEHTDIHIQSFAVYENPTEIR